MSADETHTFDEGERKPLGAMQRAWCVLMFVVMLSSAAVFGVFINDMLHPENAPVVRMELAALTPQPGFDL
ncbi:hypothetical protein [Aurantiacibacter rhizosphaerae]|uniref:Uncharacterized protein n=1 Tax=Aurantiacibacter rhizosphaerae TaxID=2691582 RepID=A0A844XGX5_9SPHN|nr:hypothetical protein [Aurantiacibacter rhizosphaerae]MWV28785.1 hypothetical protein [Aurantiacibacter rhizosphaerae]